MGQSAMVRNIFKPKYILVLCFGIAACFTFFYACSPAPKTENLFYLNHNDTVNYVGMSTCAACHENKFNTFKRTGMGSSFHFAKLSESSADFSKAHVVYDSFLNFYYQPFWSNNTLYIMEYRLKNGDTIHKRTEKIDYIIGSGQHTNSHLMLRNGYVYQAPLTWYSQVKSWGLPPGFEKGNNTRFSRIINSECMSCHNALPELETQTDNKFTKIGNGIDCERCHGPGELHVNLRLKGKTIKSKDGIDRTIINPAKLSWQQQVDLCQRCHLQGNAVLHDGRKFTDFRPGMKLSDFMDVYMPQYSDKGSEMIMASHAQRLQMSQCFVKSNQGKNQNLQLTCITCHNPHVSVKETGVNQFNDACKKCHAKQDACTAPISDRTAVDNNCVQCHMPKTGTADIPHVRVHDHYIRKKYEQPKPAGKQLLGLYCINNDNPDEVSKIKAYLSYYEKFEPNPFYLEQVAKLLKNNENPELQVYYYYLKKDDKALLKWVGKLDDESKDAWTFYRIGQAYFNSRNFESAEKYFEKALNISPQNFDFLYKQSAVKHALGKVIEEESLLKKVITLNANHTAALNNLGYLYFKKGDMSLAGNYYKKALNNDPDYIEAKKNLFDWYINSGNTLKAKQMAAEILEKEPGNQVLMNFIKQASGMN